MTVTGVEVQQQAADESWSTVATLGATSTTHTVTGLAAGTAYTFRIRLVTSSGNADTDAVSTDTLAAARPATGLTASNATQTTISLSWTMPTQGPGVSVTGVTVQKQTGKYWSTVETLGGTATTHTVTGLRAGTTYSFRIRVDVAGGGRAYSQPVSTSTLESPKSATSLGAYGTGRLTETELRWTLPAQPAGVTVENVEVHAMSDGMPPWTTVATLAPDATSHTVIGLTPGAVYWFRIRLVTNEGNADSDRIVILMRALPKPVFDFSASDATQTTVPLSWKKPAIFPAAPTVSSIEVQQQGADGSWSTVRTFTGRWVVELESQAKPMAHTVTGLTAGTAYTFRVRVVANSGSADSESLSVTTLGRDVNPAIGLTASNPTETTLDLSWTLPAQPEGVTVTGAEVQQQSGGCLEYGGDARRRCDLTHGDGADRRHVL